MGRSSDNSDYSNYSDYTDNTNSKHRRRHRRSCSTSSNDSRHCSSDCGLKQSSTPVGVWNIVTQFDTVTSGTSGTSSTTTSNTIDQPSQLLMNEGGTFSNNSTPDLQNNPFNALLTTGVGVWKLVSDRKIKLESTTIAYKASNGVPIVYYKVHVDMKLNRSGTKVRFCGMAVPKSLDDPSLCTDSSMPTITFSGYGYKVLEPCR